MNTTHVIEPDPGQTGTQPLQLKNESTNPAGLSIIVLAGLGIAAALVFRALTPPPPPRNRAVRILEDIQKRLTDLSKPVYERATSLAENGAHVLSRGVDSIGELHLEHKLGKLSRWLRRRNFYSVKVAIRFGMVQQSAC